MTTRRTTTTSSFTPTICARHWRWPAEPPSTSPTGRRRRSCGAFDAADGKDVRIGGGAAVIRQYLRAGLIDELHLAIAPLLIGRGERLLDDLGDGIDGYRVSELVSSPNVTHAILLRS